MDSQELRDNEEKEIQEKALPDKKLRLAVSPYLTDTVVYDVADREDNKSASLAVIEEWDLFCLKNVCRDEANREERAEKHEQQAHLCLFFFRFSCFYLDGVTKHPSHDLILYFGVYRNFMILQHVIDKCQ